MYPGCGRTFSRPADLARHYAEQHPDPDMRKSFHCGYNSCARFRRPFTRIYHLRSHLRDYHKEPIGNFRGEYTMQDGEEQKQGRGTWLDQRVYAASWWRCEKCMRRIAVFNSGYECNNCKMMCKPEIVECMKLLQDAQIEQGHVRTTSEGLLRAEEMTPKGSVEGDQTASSYGLRSGPSVSPGPSWPSVCPPFQILSPLR